MSDAAGWYARKLSQLRGQQQAPAPSYPANGPYRQPTQYSQVQQVQPQYRQVPVREEPQPVPQADQVTTIENLYMQAAHWHGGQAHKTDKEPCPSCGGNQYYSRAAGKRGPPPASHCYNCGYNGGLFEQGLASSWNA